MKLTEPSIWSWTPSKSSPNCWPLTPLNSAFPSWDHSSEPPAAIDVGVVIDLAMRVAEYLSALSGAMLDFVTVTNSMADLTTESQEALDKFGSGSGSGGTTHGGNGGTGRTEGTIVLC